MIYIMYNHTFKGMPYTWFAHGVVSTEGPISDDVVAVINAHNSRHQYEESEGKEDVEEFGCCQLKIALCSSGYRFWAEYCKEEGELAVVGITIIPLQSEVLNRVLINMLTSADGACNAMCVRV
jgi:hypothetical protein